MIKKLLLTAAFILPTITHAKSPSTVVDFINTNQNTIEKDSYCNNWFISVGAGEQLLSNENEKVLDIGEHIVPSKDVTIAKWLSPGIGIHAMYSGLSVQGTRHKNDISPEQPFGHTPLSTSEQMNLHAGILFSGSNLVFGYNEQRIWNVIPYNNYPLTQTTNRHKEVNEGAIKLLKKFKENQTVNINLNIRGIFVGNCNREENAEQKDGIFSASIALTYGQPNQKKKRVHIPIYNDDRWLEYSKRINYSTEQEQHLTILLPNTNEEGNLH